MKSSIQRVKTKPKAIVLFGPTAVGKTALTEALFSEGFEIINSDSVQVYRGLDIGSAKPEKELQDKIPHHLVDIRDPHQQYTVGDFLRDAESLVYQINERGNIPLLTGGTAYYFKQFIYSRAQTPAADVSIRERVKALIEQNGVEWAYSELMRVDSTSASRININDVYRVSRALEVYYQTGKPLSSFVLGDEMRDDIDILILALTRDKKILDDRIDKRVDIMFSMGLYDEIKALIRRGATSSWPGMQGIGYQEFFLARESGEMNMDAIKKEIALNSRKYAKRQMTFFRSFPDANFVSPEDVDTIKGLVDSFLSR